MSRRHSCAALFWTFRSRPLSFLPLRVGASELTCVKCYCLNLPAEKTKTPEIISALRAALSCRTKTLSRTRLRGPSRRPPCVWRTAARFLRPGSSGSRLPQPSWSRGAHQSSRALTGSASSICETQGLCACTLGGTSLGQPVSAAVNPTLQ